MVVSDADNPRQEGAVTRVHQGEALYPIENGIIPNLDMRDAEERFAASGKSVCYMGALESQIELVFEISPLSYLVRIVHTFSSHTNISLFYVFDWDVCVPAIFDDDGYGNPPAPMPIAVSHDDGFLRGMCAQQLREASRSSWFFFSMLGISPRALCADGGIIDLLLGECWNRGSAVFKGAYWVNDGKYLVAERKQQSFCIFDKKFNVLASTEPHGPDIAAIAFSEKAGIFATSTSTRRVRVWNTADGHLLSKKRFSENVKAISFVDDSTVAVTLESGAVVQWLFEDDNELVSRSGDQPKEPMAQTLKE